MKTKFKKIILFLITVLIITTVFILKLNKMKADYEKQITELKSQYENKIAGLNSYEYLYKENEKDLVTSNRKYKNLEKEYLAFKDTVAVSKQDNARLSRGGNVDLRTFTPISTDELDEWIKEKAPKNSPFIGRAKVFIKASKQSGLDPKYIVSHAALESDWGRSTIARQKNNYFGIGSFNNSPYESSYTFNDGLEKGIIEGAIWINNNYTSKGQNTVNSMIYGNPKNIYAQNNDGSPNTKWASDINGIMK